MVQGTYFDGHRATAHAVIIAIAADRVVVTGSDIHRDEPLGAVVISERIGQTTRFLRFSDNAICQIDDVETLHAALAAEGVEQDSLSLWEHNRRLVAVLTVALILFGIGAYRYGLPFLAASAASRVPPAVVSGISTRTLAFLDATVFERTDISPWFQTHLRGRFAALKLPREADPPLTLLFRKSKALGANALALPSGAIIITDDLVVLGRDDEELLAVLAHEAGHVQNRHGLRNVIQSSVVSILVTWYLGDFSGLLAAPPSALLEAKYSRDLERDADDYAARTLRMNGISTGALADILERMGRQRPDDTANLAAAMSYLSSHPATTERMDALRRDPR